MNTDAHCLLWDFGDTLCDEKFIFQGRPEWMRLYDTFDDGPAASWCCGEFDTAAFAAAATALVGMSEREIIDYMTQRCSEISWFPHAWQALRNKHRPQAIVTVNPDLFSSVIVPLYELDRYVDTIVTSWEARTNNKADLCSIAIDRIGPSIDQSKAMLIDNKKSSVDDWIQRGGMGYHFTTDDRFASDFELI